MTRSTTILLISILTISAAEGEAKEHVCTSQYGADERRIKIVYPTKHTLPCKTHYKKNGEWRQIAWAEHTEGVCEHHADKTLRKLVKAKFNCETRNDEPKQTRPKLAKAQGGRRGNIVSAKPKQQRALCCAFS